MIQKRDLLILSELRKDSRKSLTDISRKTKIPVSTIFDQIRTYQGKIISKFTTIINFSLFGFNTRANIILKVEKSSRERLRNFLVKHSRVNSLYRINNGFDFMVECLFYDVKELEDFIRELEDYNTITIKVYYIIDDIKREAFLENIFRGTR